MQKLGKEDQVSLEEIVETEDPIRFQGFNLEPESPLMMERKTGYGVWVYSSISKPFDLKPLTGFLQKIWCSVDFREPISIEGNRGSRPG